MTTKTLIEQLKRLPGDESIVLASDEEGNTFFTLGEITREDAGIILWPTNEAVDVE